MKIIDKRTLTATKDFGELPIGTVFEFPVGSQQAEWFGVCMKIASTDCDDNAIDLEDGEVVFNVAPNAQVCELVAHLVIKRG